MADSGGDAPGQRSDPQRGYGRKIAGPLATLLLAGALIGLRHYDVLVPNPVLAFVNCIVVSAFLGGLYGGLASLAITLGFALVYWSIPGQLLTYTPIDRDRLAVLAVTMPPLAILVGWLRGAHDRKQRELADQNARLVAELARREAMEASQRDVERILSHDLRTPLSGLITIPQVLLDDDNLTPQQREMLTMISAVGRKMLNQIHTSLELRKIEDRSYTLNARPCTPAQIVRDTYTMLIMSGYSDKTLLQVREAAPITVQTDPLLLDSIIANLLRNALEASDPGHPVVVTVAEEAGQCALAIHNNRPVPQAIRDRFFEKYVTAEKTNGTGLGTYSAQLMTHAIGGSIALETSEGHGTTVTVRLPLIPHSDA